jgi:hypothetical protein
MGGGLHGDRPQIGKDDDAPGRSRQMATQGQIGLGRLERPRIAFQLPRQAHHVTFLRGIDGDIE